MPGWDSLEAVSRIQNVAQIAGLVLLALLAAGAVLLFLQLRRGGWPAWIDVGSYQVRSVVCEIAVAAVLALLVLTALAAIGYGVRRSALMAAADQAHADQLRRVVEEAQARQAEAKAGSAADNPAQQQHHLRELTELRRKLTEGESQGADLRRKLADTERQLAELQRKPTEPDGQVTELRRKLTEGESQVADLRRKLADTERQLTELQRKPTEPDNQVIELRRQLTEGESQVADLRRKLADTERQLTALQRKPTEPDNQVTELRRKLSETESRLTDLQRKQMQKRLSEDDKKLLIEALTPFAGQKISIASRAGDDDGKALAEDFVAVFDAARWDHGGDAGISVQRWDRDPVGIEIVLNETDARAGRISSGIGALINAVRKLGLAYDNTIYMSRDVPPGQAVVKVGRTLRK
jgi:hypothetical protein